MATKANLIIDQGSDFILDIEVTRANNSLVNLTGYTGAAHLRKSYTTEIYKAFVVSTGVGVVQLRMNFANTDSLTPGQYVWDCELTENNTNVITRIVEGIVTVTPSVTR